MHLPIAPDVHAKLMLSAVARYMPSWSHAPFIAYARGGLIGGTVGGMIGCGSTHAGCHCPVVGSRRSSAYCHRAPGWLGGNTFAIRSAASVSSGADASNVTPTSSVPLRSEETSSPA